MPGVAVGNHATLRLIDGNEVQPDAMLRLSRNRGGRSWLDTESYVVGVPELVAEVAASSASYDLHVKKDLYERTGIPEYIVWRTEDETIDWFVLEAGRYVRLAPDAAGLTRSRVFPGLALDLSALIAAVREAIEESREGR